MSNPSPEQLASEFKSVLSYWLTRDELIQIDLLNAGDDNSSVCHSHDFCDANQAMLDAMERHGMDFDPSDESQASLINAAWTIAKQSGFSK